MTVEVKNMNLLADSGKTKAICDLVFDDALRVKGIRVVDGEKGLFAAMPSRKKGEEYENILQIPDEALRDKVRSKVLEAYQKKGEQA